MILKNPVNKSRRLLGFLFIAGILSEGGWSGCSGKSPETVEKLPPTAQKINFDLSELNEDGLYGPPDGLRALHYEFCIPADSQYAREVRNIDSSVEIYPVAAGRIGCSGREFLCIGNTHRKNFREVLIKLAKLDYVQQIEQSFFE